MPHVSPTHHETSKCDSPNETKIKEKQNKTMPDSNSNLAKSMTHHNQTKELTTWFLIHVNHCIPSTLHHFLIQWIDDEIEVVHTNVSAYIALVDATAD
jgi:hypothetical protein